MENTFEKAEVAWPGMWPFNLREICWAEQRQEKAAEFWVESGFGFCLLLLLDMLDFVSGNELLKSLEEVC